MDLVNNIADLFVLHFSFSQPLSRYMPPVFNIVEGHSPVLQPWNPSKISLVFSISYLQYNFIKKT